MNARSQKAFEKYSREVKGYSDYELEKSEDYPLQYENTEAQFDWQLYQYARKQGLKEAISFFKANETNLFCGSRADHLKELYE